MSVVMSAALRACGVPHPGIPGVLCAQFAGHGGSHIRPVDGHAVTWRDEPKPKPARLVWDDYFFKIAAVVATRATCPRASIGVVIVDDDHRVLATGYNGAPSKQPHCTDVGCTIFADHCVRSVHAEVNAVRSHQRAYGDESHLAGTTAYVVGPRPICSHCARELHAAGVREVKWREAAP